MVGYYWLRPKIDFSYEEVIFRRLRLVFTLQFQFFDLLFGLFRKMVSFNKLNLNMTIRGKRFDV